MASSDLLPGGPLRRPQRGTVRGGVAVNVVPDRCALEVGVRLLPGMDAGDREPACGRRWPGAAPADRQPEVERLSASPPLETAAGAR